MNSAKDRFTPFVEQVLREAGWFPGRQLDESQLQPWLALKWEYEAGYCRIFPKALQVLREFGGLCIKQDAPGVTCYRSSFCLDPLKAVADMDSHCIKYEWFLDTQLYPLGIYGSRDIVIAISQQGQIYLFHYDGGSFQAENFDEALENLITGIMGQDIPVDDAKLASDKEAKLVQKAVRRLFKFPLERHES